MFAKAVNPGARFEQDGRNLHRIPRRPLAKALVAVRRNVVQERRLVHSCRPGVDQFWIFAQQTLEGCRVAAHDGISGRLELRDWRTAFPESLDMVREFLPVRESV